MRASSLIGHIAEVLDAILISRKPADVLLKEFYRKRHYLGSRDRRYISENLFGILRNHRLLDFTVHQALKASGPVVRIPRVPGIAFCAAYAVKVLGEAPDRLVPEIGGLWRVSMPDVDCLTFLVGLATSVLPEAVLADPGRRIALQHSMPDMVVQEWLGRFGTEETELLCIASNRPAPTTLRVNMLRCSVAECRETLKAEGIETFPTPLSPSGLLLKKRVNLQALPAFRRGLFEVQDEGSQLLAMLLSPVAGQTIVDACSGGGGKTMHLAALLRNSGSLIAIDIDRKRLQSVERRALRAGAAVAQLLLAGRDDAAIERLQGRADAVLVDAPCSGIGTFRRNPGGKLTFSPDFVAEISGTQRAILEKYAPLVRPGGRLVYSTCTLLRRENEEVVESFLMRHPDFAILPVAPILHGQGVNVALEGPTLLLLPHKTGTDGFFAAVMLRAG